MQKNSANNETVKGIIIPVPRETRSVLFSVFPTSKSMSIKIQLTICVICNDFPFDFNEINILCSSNLSVLSSVDIALEILLCSNPIPINKSNDKRINFLMLKLVIKIVINNSSPKIVQKTPSTNELLLYIFILVILHFFIFFQAA